MLTKNQIIGKLKNTHSLEYTENGAGNEIGRAYCPIPGHSGSSRTLAVYETSTDIWLKCYGANCPGHKDQKRIWEQLGIERPSNEVKVSVATYNHHALLKNGDIKVFRAERHDFIRNGVAEKHYKAKKPRNTKCFLPMPGYQKGKVVLITEGEKDAVEGGRKRGFNSTCWPYGAGSVSQTDWDYLECPEVILWGDQDDGGIEAMEWLGCELYDKGVRVGWISSEFGAADVSGEEFHDIINGAKLWKPTDEIRERVADRLHKRKNHNNDPKWMRTYDAEFQRLLQAHPTEIIAVNQDEKELASLYVAGNNGIWREDRNKIHSLIIAQTDRWFKEASSHAKLKEVSLGWRNKMASATERNKVMQSGGGIMQKNIIDASMLDEDRRFMGAKNGVIYHKNGGELLTGAHAREALVSRMLPDPFVPDMHKETIYKKKRIDELLFGHIPDADYLIDALAYALLCRVSKRFYSLYGPPDGGKSTIATAIMKALGSEYCASLNPAVITKASNREGASSEMETLVRNPITFIPEMPQDRINTETFLAITGGDAIAWRKLYANDRTSQIISTLFIMSNFVPNLRLANKAITTRFKAVEIPSLPRMDHEICYFLKTSVLARQAIVSLLVSRVKEQPPDDTKGVAQSIQKAKDEALGSFGAWATSVCQKTGNDRDFMGTTSLWRSAMTWDAPNEYPFGFTSQKRFTEEIKDLLDIQEKAVQKDKERGWFGWRNNSMG